MRKDFATKLSEEVISALITHNTLSQQFFYYTLIPLLHNLITWNRSRMQRIQLLRYLLLAASLQVTPAFHEVVGIERKSSKRRLVDDKPSSSSSSLANNNDRLASAARVKDTTTSTALYASRHQFRNVEEMLDTFEGQMVLINFMAINCGPCRLQKKELASVSRAVGNDLHLLAIDTNRWPSVSSRFDVGKLPCLVAMKNGQVLFRIEGFTKAEDVVAHVRSVQKQQQQQ